MVWEEACYFPNILQTEFLDDTEEAQPELPDSDLERAWLPGKIFYNVPAVLHTCFESRRVALRIYNQVGNPFKAQKIYMNREVDIMFYEHFWLIEATYWFAKSPDIRAAHPHAFPKHDYIPQHILVDESWDEDELQSTCILEWMPGLKTIMSRSSGTPDVVEISKTEDFKHKLIVGENDKMPTLRFLTAEQIASMRPEPALPFLLHPNIPSEYRNSRSRVYSRLRILPSWAAPYFKLFQQELQKLSNRTPHLRSQQVYVPPFDHSIWLSLERIRRYKLEYYRLRSLFDITYEIYDNISDAFQSSNCMPVIGEGYNMDKWAEGTVEGGAFPYKHPYWQNDLRHNTWMKDTHHIGAVLYKHTRWENHFRRQFCKLPDSEKARLYTLALRSASGWIVHMGRKTTGGD